VSEGPRRELTDERLGSTTICQVFHSFTRLSLRDCRGDSTRFGEPEAVRHKGLQIGLWIDTTQRRKLIALGHRVARISTSGHARTRTMNARNTAWIGHLQASFYRKA
jgi:hypothetical protein